MANKPGDRYDVEVLLKVHRIGDDPKDDFHELINRQPNVDYGNMLMSQHLAVNSLARGFAQAGLTFGVARDLISGEQIAEVQATLERLYGPMEVDPGGKKPRVNP